MMGFDKFKDYIDKNAEMFNYNQNYNQIDRVLEKKGVYVMFENGQIDNNGGKRIVRIGAANNLRNRLKQHFEGKGGKSIFRKHVGEALGMNKKDDISNYIKANFSFALIYIPKILSVDELESALIAMLADYSKDLVIKNWIGLNSKNKTIKKYNIWNHQGCKQKKGCSLQLDDYLEDLIEIGLVKK